jgi:hypothetical protein
MESIPDTYSTHSIESAEIMVTTALPVAVVVTAFGRSFCPFSGTT